MFLNRQALYLRPDPTRVVVRPFKPAIEPRDLNPTDKTRANHIVGRVLGLEPDAADRIDLDRLAEVGDGVVVLALKPVGLAAVVAGTGVFRIDLDRLVVAMASRSIVNSSISLLLTKLAKFRQVPLPRAIDTTKSVMHLASNLRDAVVQNL